MTRIKIVPIASPNADGEWIDVPVDFPERTRWRQMESLVKNYIPEGHFIVSVERGHGSRNVTSD
jgi:hypothetical protein